MAKNKGNRWGTPTLKNRSAHPAKSGMNSIFARMNYRQQFKQCGRARGD